MSSQKHALDTKYKPWFIFINKQAVKIAIKHNHSQIKMLVCVCCRVSTINKVGKIGNRGSDDTVEKIIITKMLQGKTITTKISELL